MEKIWLNSYGDEIPHDVDIDAYRSIVEVLDTSVRRFSARPAFSNMGTTLTYAQLDDLSRAFACYLQKELGLTRGERVAIMMPNLLQYPIAVFGALRAGLVVVNVNPLYTARELVHQLADSGAVAIVIVANFAHVLAKALTGTAVRHVVVTELGDMLKFPKRLIVNLVVKHVKKMVPPFSLPAAVGFSQALERGRRRNFEPVEIKPEDLAFLQYTGGTTGVSKGAMLTHRNVIANLQQVAAWLAPHATEGREIVITALPLYHIFALTANCLTFTKFGGLNVLITNPRDIPGFVAELAKWPFTAITAVNTLFNALLANPDFARLDFSSVRIVVGGAMAVQRAVAEKWRTVTRTTIAEGYGLTEASPVVAVNPLDLKEYNGSIGLPLPSTEISIRDDDGVEVPLGERGELWVRGPQVMRGYWQHAEETDKVLTSEGWLKTGDVATIDDKGFLRIVDRIKDMILVSGFNVYPNEVEEVIAHHPGVLEVAAVGVPDERTGEAVKLVIVKRDPTLTEDQVLAFGREQLTGYKVPKLVEFRTELPKSNVGKILRRHLRDGAATAAGAPASPS